MRVLIATATLAGASLTVAPPAVAQDDARDPRLLRVRVADHEIDPALDAFVLDGVLYLPAVRLAELVERPHRLSSNGLTLLIEGPGPADETVLDLTPGGPSMIIEGGAVFIPLDRAEVLFSVDLQADLDRDVLVLEPANETALPVGERLKREAGWRRLAGAQDEPDTAFTVETPWAAFAPVMGDVVVTGRSASDGSWSLDYNALVVGEMAWLTHELYVSGRADGPPDDLRLTSGRRAYEGGVLGVSSLYEAVAGDVYGHTVPLVGRVPMGRGVSLTGRPLTQPTDFDVTLVEGDALPGWDAEIYRNGELLAIQRIGDDGRYRFEDVALTAGRNLLLVRLYGPQGQMREVTQTIGVGADMPPPGAVHWAAFINQPDQRLLAPLLDREARFTDAAGAVLMEVGLTRAVSAGAFVAHAPVSGRRGSRFDSYFGAVLRSALGPAAIETAATARQAGGWAWRAGVLTSLGPASLTVRHEEYMGGYRSADAELGASPLRRFTRGRISAPLSILGVGLGSISLGADRYELETGQRELAARLNWRVDMSGVHFDHGVEYRDTRREDGVALNRAFYVGAAALTRGPLSARAAVRYALSGETGLESYDLGLQYRVSDTLIVSAGIFRDEVNGKTGGNLGLSRDLGFAFLTLGAAWGDDGEYTLGAGLTFSFGFASEGGARLSSRPQARLGAIEPFVFLDRAADGRYQPGVDEPLPGVQLLVNRYPDPAARTDAAGRAWVAGAAPGQPVRLGVDVASLPDAFLVPARAEVMIEPRPGRAVRLDIPIVETGEISGRVELLDEATRAPLRGFRLELVDEGGAVRATAVSMFDGVWVFDEVPPGRWTVRPRPGQQVAGAVAAPVLIHTTVGPRSLVDGIGIQVDARTGLTDYAITVAQARSPGDERADP